LSSFASRRLAAIAHARPRQQVSAFAAAAATRRIRQLAPGEMAPTEGTGIRGAPGGIIGSPQRGDRSMRSTPLALLASALLAIGIALGGWFVGQGFVDARAGDRFVTVKGVAERLVAADLALWPIRFVTTSNQLAEAQARIAEDEGRVLSFLAANGLARQSVEVQSLQVTDLLAQAYRSSPIESRFIVTQTLMVRTAEVDKVALASQRIGDLLAAGVVLSSEGQPSPGPSYLLTRLNDIKPGMIAEATRSAREGAEQFAKDSASRISGIRRASQGLFEILPRDNTPGMSQEQQIAKTVRVVSTIDYALAD